MEARAECAYENTHNDGAACETKLYGNRYARYCQGDAAYHEAKNHSNEHRNKVWLVKALHGVAKNLLHSFDVGCFTHHCKAVAKLQYKVGGCQQLHLGTVDTADVDAVVVA